ncbi:hypothetical protein CONPUDRAFT_51206 [Coniophora puteana RWD-64-598 SS2]|uniref:Uncharacterized protein n=1 Tax=Coniophora puteana (strain RWD-64-598) TaxID=741705 RepID=A0A5M3MZU2_CONPW|nr:uncharacterized protein CONPUDRAFT_51206 [Coniophora puteana RWD-64-598 SS2]EIW84165.1 hypothetical protein CONPUDRAFT_51206 [Coniophora puteana RWD-64-598 SS2]
MHVHGFHLPQEVTVNLLCKCANIPATCKTTGKASHSYKTHPCNYCFVTLEDINADGAYDIDTNFCMRNDWNQLKQAQLSTLARSIAARKAVINIHSVCYSALNNLPRWMTTALSLVNFMHNFYHDFSILYFIYCYAYCNINALYKDTINSIIWPSSIGHLPSNLDSNHSLPKADQWRHLCHVLPYMLWICWKNTWGKIRSAYQTKPKVSYNMAAHSQGYIQLYCQGLQALSIPLTVNHHLAMYYSEVLQRYGPVYTCWLFGFECFNGLFEKVNLNSHRGGEMEYSLVRNWVEKQHLHKLVSVIFALNSYFQYCMHVEMIFLPKNASEKEHQLVDRVMHTKGLDCGTLSNQTLQFMGGEFSFNDSILICA